MDSFEFDNVKAEKVKAIRRFNRLRGLAKVFRFVELLLALLFLCWTFERIPFAVRISGEFVLKLGGVVASPLFVFVVCNVIIVTLIAKSGMFSAVDNVDSKIYDEIIKKTENGSKMESPQEIVYQDKVIISEVNTSTRTSEEIDGEPESDADAESENPRVYRRSKSEVAIKTSTDDKPEMKLRRSETDCYRKIEKTDEEMSPEDELSNEDFQRTIEDFIAKQLRFRREESMSIVLQS